MLGLIGWTDVSQPAVHAPSHEDGLVFFEHHAVLRGGSTSADDTSGISMYSGACLYTARFYRSRKKNSTVLLSVCGVPLMLYVADTRGPLPVLVVER